MRDADESGSLGSEEGGSSRLAARRRLSEERRTDDRSTHFIDIVKVEAAENQYSSSP
jgi:hypothetical protein